MEEPVESDSEALKEVLVELFSGDISRVQQALYLFEKLSESNVFRVRGLRELLLMNNPVSIHKAVSQCLLEKKSYIADILDDCELFTSCVDIPDESLVLSGSLLDELLLGSELEDGVLFRCIVLLAKIRTRLSDNVEAARLLHIALPLSDSIYGLLGLIECKLLMGDTKEAREQMEFLSETQSAARESALFLFLEYRLTGDVSCLNSALNMHISSFRAVDRKSLKYLSAMNSQFMYEIADALQASDCVARAIKVLETLLRVFPRSEKVILLLANCYEKIMKPPDSVIAILRTGWTINVAIRLAETLWVIGELKLAMESLEEAQARNLKVRHVSIFWLLKAQLADDNSVIPILSEGLKLVQDRREGRLHRKLVEAYIDKGDFEAASGFLLSECDSPELMHLLRAKVCSAQGQPEAALAELECVPRTAKEHQESVILKLEIFITKKSKLKFRKILRDNVSDWYSLAYWHLRIGDVDDAITCLQQLNSSNDGKVGELLAESYVLAHRYEEAIPLLQNNDKLVELLLQIHRYDEAIRLMDKTSVEILRAIDSAWKWTENKEWLSRGIETAQLTTGDIVCLSEMHVLLAEWELALNRIDEAFRDYQTAIKLNSKNERALLGISRLILINRGDRDFAFSCLTQISSPLYKHNALELLSHYETHAVEILPKHISNEFIDQLRASKVAAPCSLLVTALYRLDRLDDPSIPSELDCPHEKILFASLKGFWEGNEGELRKGIDILPPGDKRDRLLIKLTHLLYFTFARTEDTLLQGISFKDTPEFIFYSALIHNSGTCPDGIAKMVLDSVINKKRRKFFLKQIFNSAKSMTGFSDLEFSLTVTALRSLSEIYISSKKYEKAISVLEMLCGLCRGDKRSLSRLGTCYFHQRMWAEAVEALSMCGTEESYPFLAKALSKQQNWKGVVDLALKCGDNRLNELTWKSLMRLH